MARILRWLIAGSLVVVQAACSDSVAPVYPNGVLIAPADTAIHQLDTFTPRVTVVDSAGHPLPVRATLTSSDSAIVRVTPAGALHSVGPIGTVFVTATAGPFYSLMIVRVLDSNVVTRLPLGQRPSFLAVSGNTAYVSRVDGAKVQVLSLATSTFIDSIAVGSVPCGVVFNRAGTKAYVANQFSDNVSIINPASRVQTGTIAVHGDPLPVAMPAGDSVLFVTTNADRLFKINTRNNTVVDSLPLPATSHHLFVHPNDTLLYVATRDAGTVLEVNWRTMSIVRTFTLGVQTLGMEMAPNRSELYVTSGSTDSLYTVTLSSGAIASAPVGAGASTIALSADGTQLYVGLLFAGQVEVLNRATRAHVKTIVTGGVVRDMATDVARNRVVITNESGWVDIVR